MTREATGGANCRTARGSERRELPNGARCRTARGAERRDYGAGDYEARDYYQRTTGL